MRGKKCSTRVADCGSEMEFRLVLLVTWGFWVLDSSIEEAQGGPH